MFFGFELKHMGEARYRRAYHHQDAYFPCTVPVIEPAQISNQCSHSLPCHSHATKLENLLELLTANRLWPSNAFRQAVPEHIFESSGDVVCTCVALVEFLRHGAPSFVASGYDFLRQAFRQPGFQHSPDGGVKPLVLPQHHSENHEQRHLLVEHEVLCHSLALASVLIAFREQSEEWTFYLMAGFSLRRCQVWIRGLSWAAYMCEGDANQAGEHAGRLVAGGLLGGKREMMNISRCPWCWRFICICCRMLFVFIFCIPKEKCLTLPSQLLLQLFHHSF